MSTTPQQHAAFTSFLDAIHTSDGEAIAQHLAEDVVLNSPFLVEPIEGRATVAKVLQTVSGLADDLTATEILVGESHFAAFFRLQIGETVVDGMDYAQLDAHNKISELSVLWRPLPSLVAMQAHIAPIIGVPVLELRTKVA